MRDDEITIGFLLRAYTMGYFPMARSRDAQELEWYYPEKRGIIPLESFHVPRSLARAMRKQPFTITVNRAFPQVIAACGELNDSRKETWINATILRLYTELWQRGYAHSIECWDRGPETRSAGRDSPEPCSMELPDGNSGSHQTLIGGPALSDAPCEGQMARSGDNNKSGNSYTLIGGLYGVAIGGAFFGESMFSRTSNASRVALVHLVGLLRQGGYRLLDTQFINPHLLQFGAVEIAREEYLELLQEALQVTPEIVFSSR